VETGLRETTSADDAKTSLFGLEGNLAYWIVGTGIAGIVFFSFAYVILKTSAVPTFLACFAPRLVTTFVIVRFVNKNPRG
jgi:hypothetical protein